MRAESRNYGKRFCNYDIRVLPVNPRELQDGGKDGVFVDDLLLLPHYYYHRRRRWKTLMFL